MYMCQRGSWRVYIKVIFLDRIYIYIYTYICQCFNTSTCQNQLFYSSQQRTAKIHLTVKSNKLQNIKCACDYEAVSETSFRINQN